MLTIQMVNVDSVDALLPQTQCGLCGYDEGCRPYAIAMLDGERANRCVPGGQPVADALAHLLGRPILPAEPSVWPLAADGRPQRVKAVIREDECIGCAKCLAACPVDAIVGSGKLMHTVIADDCTGCELCLAPCPVDCIDLVVDTTPLLNEQDRLHQQALLRQRYARHQKRYNDAQVKKMQKAHPLRLVSINAEPTDYVTRSSSHTVDPQVTILAATLRSQLKKLERQLQRASDHKQQVDLSTQISEIQQQLSHLMVSSSK